jgi:hypothetical protein
MLKSAFIVEAKAVKAYSEFPAASEFGEFKDW